MSSKAKTIINKSDTDDVFDSIYSTNISNTRNNIEKGAVWIIDWLVDNTINISKCNPLNSSTCIKLPKELHHPKKDWLISKVLTID